MTSTKPMPTTIVTPHKMQTDRKVQARLLNRALGLTSSNGDNHDIFTGTQQQQQTQNLKATSVPQENQQVSPSPSCNKARVFRCLSNTKGAHSMKSPASPASSSRAKAQRSALKSMFQPPASSPSRNLKRSPRQQQEQFRTAQVVRSHSSVFFGSRLDRSSLSSRQLRRANGTENTNDTNKKVHFKPTVAVVRIPSHREYPSSIKKTLWGSTKEIKANAIRNTAEFIFDKCNWRKCTEEDHFYRDTRNGSLIHPVHVHRYYAAMKKMQAEQAKKKQQQQDEEEKSKNSSDEEEERELQQMPEEPPRISRKRVRCCSPSPIRRSHLNNPEYERERQEAKRARRNIQVPIPQCRQPVYYSPHPPQGPTYAHSPLQQQENSYAYYKYDHQSQSHPHNSMMMMHPYPFPHHSRPLPPSA